jgi:hypothetical protein
VTKFSLSDHIGLMAAHLHKYFFRLMHGSFFFRIASPKSPHSL